MAAEIAPRRLQPWKKKELRENRSEAGAPNAGRDCEGDGIDVPWGGDGRVKHFIPGGLDSSSCQTERVEPFRGVVFACLGWAAAEVERLGAVMRRAALLRPGDFFLPRELPRQFKFMQAAGPEDWTAFFVGAGWPAELARALAGGGSR